MRPQKEIIQELKIQEHRGCGRVHLFISTREELGGDKTAALEQRVKSWGFLSVPDIEIDRPTAESIAKRILTRDLAYCAECMPEAAAEVYINEFLTEFSSNCKFFTNGVYSHSSARLSSYTPITKSTFDSGILAVDLDKFGLLWVEDED